jgi:hypothetical protein
MAQPAQRYFFAGLGLLGFFVGFHCPSARDDLLVGAQIKT